MDLVNNMCKEKKSVLFFSSYISLLSQSLNQMFIKLRYVIAYFIGKTTVQESIYLQN